MSDEAGGPFDALTLGRWPPREHDALRAWDGADRYLLEALDEEGIEGPILLVGDAFGALGTALAGRATSWGDSDLSRRALEANLQANRCPPVPWWPLTQSPSGSFAAALVRLPRSLRRLSMVAQRVAPLLAPGAVLLAGAKSKDVQQSAVRVIDGAIGPAASTLARHRARLIRAVRDGRTAPPLEERSVEIEPGLRQRAFAGVFGEEALDGGTALLLSFVTEWPGAGLIVDLGCGAGPLGLVAARRNPGATVCFRDSSHLAVASAERAFAEAGLPNLGRFEVGDCLEGVADHSVDVVLCNPPFHEGRVVSRRVAARMFEQSTRALRRGGRLLVVGNRHLGYGQVLRRHFATVRALGADRRFEVWEGLRA